MCISFSQYWLNFDKNKIITDPKIMGQLYSIFNSIANNNPKNLRTTLWNDAIIIPQSNPHIAEHSQFAWVENKKCGGTWPVFNVRVEGGWNNKSNDPNYRGPYQIFNNPYVKDIIMNHRCVVPVDFFIEQPTDKKVKRKYIIKKEDESPLFLAGVYKEIINPETGEITSFFAIKTTASSNITQKVGHERSPVIIENNDIINYLDNNATHKDLAQFYAPNNNHHFIAYEVNPIITKRDCPFAKDDLTLIEPIGNPVRVCP